MEEEKRDYSKELMTMSQLAAYLHVDYRTVSNWVKEGVVKSGYKITRNSYLFRKTEVDKWLDTVRCNGETN